MRGSWGELLGSRSASRHRGPARSARTRTQRPASAGRLRTRRGRPSRDRQHSGPKPTPALGDPVVGDARRRAARSLPSSGWPSRRPGLKQREREHERPCGRRKPRAGHRSPGARSRAVPDRRRGRSRQANAPISAGHLTADGDAGHHERRADAQAADEQDAGGEQACRATTAVAPAAITEFGVALATRALCTTSSPAASARGSGRRSAARSRSRRRARAARRASARRSDVVNAVPKRSSRIRKRRDQRRDQRQRHRHDRAEHERERASRRQAGTARRPAQTPAGLVDGPLAGDLDPRARRSRTRGEPR